MDIKTFINKAINEIIEGVDIANTAGAGIEYPRKVYFSIYVREDDDENLAIASEGERVEFSVRIA